MKTKNTVQHDPDWATPPGDTLLEILEFKGITQKELAVRTGYSVKQINQIVLGNAPITPTLAILLERVTGTAAKYWNALESQYQTRKAKIEAKERLQKDAEILKTPAVKELIKRGAIPKCTEPADQIESVLGFFAVGSVQTLRKLSELPQEAALRHTPAFKSDPLSLAAWLRLGEREAAKIECRPYDREAFQAALHQVRTLTVKSPGEFVPEMIRFCAAAGVAVLFVPEMKGAKVNGATKWLTPEKAMIVLNLRGRKNDIFWFTFFHEAAHILYDGKKAFIVDVLGDKTEKSESELKADRFAGEMLIPSGHHKELPTLKTEAAIRSFAAKLGIAPGIVVGRLQHDGLIPYTRFQGLRTTFIWGQEK